MAGWLAGGALSIQVSWWLTAQEAKSFAVGVGFEVLSGAAYPNQPAARGVLSGEAKCPSSASCPCCGGHGGGYETEHQRS